MHMSMHVKTQLHSTEKPPSFIKRRHRLHYCYVVTANCSIDAMAYSAASFGGRCLTKVGHVKLNGDVVWKAGWCHLNLPNLRGVNTLLIDPFTCSVQENRTFDTWASSSAATQLSNYLNQLIHGRVIVGVSADEASLRLSIALPTLRQFGVEVADVRYRGSFTFVVQKGYPAKTVLSKAVTQRESSIAPAHVNATITGKPAESALRLMRKRFELSSHKCRVSRNGNGDHSVFCIN